MDEQRTVVVETNLDERAGAVLVGGPKGQSVKARTRHARTRFVQHGKGAEPPEPPEIGGAWCPLTVRARLQRVGWVLRKDPRVGPRATPRSCMPETVKEIFKDQKGVPMRIPVPSADQDAVNATLVDLLRFRFDEEAKAVIYAIVEKTSGEDLGDTLRYSRTHARTLMKRMLEQLANDWNALSWRPDAVDCERARKLIHRNLK